MGNTVLLRKGIKITHLRLLAALAETRQLSAAAEVIGHYGARPATDLAALLAKA